MTGRERPPRPSGLVWMPTGGASRRAGQILECGGLASRTVASIDELQQALHEDERVALVLVPVSELGSALNVTKSFPLRVYGHLEEPDPSVFAVAAECEQLGGIFGLRYPGAPPRAWELLSIARRISVGHLPPPQAPLDWGHIWHERRLSSTEDREAMVQTVTRFCGPFQTSRQATNVAQLADELIMNAMYDAPIDASGTPKYAHNRKEVIRLEPTEQPTFGFGADGSRIVMSVNDPFGRLPRGAVFCGIHRGLTTGTMDTSGGGAGLGMMVIHQAAKVVFFDIVPGVRTQVTAILELDVPPRQARKIPGSVHFFTFGA